MKKHESNPDLKYAQQILAAKVCKYLDKDYENVNSQYFRLTYEELKVNYYNYILDEK